MDKYYIGSTGNELKQRIMKHNSYHKGFTGRANDWERVYQEIFPDKSTAFKREKEIKAWKSRTRIQLLISSVE